MKLAFSIAVLALAVSSGAQAQATLDAAAAAPTEEKKICRTEKMTGSLTRVRRTCMTEGQWRELAMRSRRAVEDTQRDAAGGTNPWFDEKNAPEAAMAAMTNPGNGGR
jgi:predicted secreted protein